MNKLSNFYLYFFTIAYIRPRQFLVFCPFGYAAKKLPLQINRWSEFLIFDTSLENRSAPLSSLLPTRSVMVLSKTCLSICKQIVTLHGAPSQPRHNQTKRQPSMWCCLRREAIAPLKGRTFKIQKNLCAVFCQIT